MSNLTDIDNLINNFQSITLYDYKNGLEGSKIIEGLFCINSNNFSFNSIFLFSFY